MRYLGYLDEWELEIKIMKELSAAQRKKFRLSAETLEGLCITGRFMHIIQNIVTSIIGFKFIQ